MRKIFLPIAAAVMAAGLSGCGETAVDIPLQNNSSELYTEEELDRSAESILATLDALGEIPESVSYLGDEICSEEAILDKLNEWERSDNEPQYTECIGFKVDHRSSVDPVIMARKLLDGKALYREEQDCQWWFARTEDGEWEMVYHDPIDIREQL